MNKIFSKRLAAYILDALIFSLIYGIFTMLIPENNNVLALNEQLSNLSESVLNNQLSTSAYLSQYAGIIHSMDKELF